MITLPLQAGRAAEAVEVYEMLADSGTRHSLSQSHGPLHFPGAWDIFDGNQAFSET